MIQQLSGNHTKSIASVLLAIVYNGLMLPAFAANNRIAFQNNTYSRREVKPKVEWPVAMAPSNMYTRLDAVNKKNNTKPVLLLKAPSEINIGGPSQPEMSAFKAAGTDNMVNLFTGDFSYNIPLMDVGGYPVNIFYDGGVSMEQEASWVGLGWNINPGNVNRNMRGIPDDFNGEEVLKQTQVMKPNITWGVNLGADFEVVGLKSLGLDMFQGSIGGSLGVSFNNYLGPALELGLRGNTGVQIGSKADAEKGAPRIGGSLSVNASSRSGVTFSGGVSLTSQAFKNSKGLSGGFGLKAGTSYNSRTGIKALQLSEQVYFNKKETEKDPSANYSGNMTATNISFAKPSYIPSLRMPLTNTAFSGHFQVGGGLFGLYPSLEVEVYKQKSEVAPADTVQLKPMVGYLYLQKAVSNSNAVMDFTRVNDNEVTPSTPVISATQYAYDVFSIQGEGTGGSVRAYRNDEGYVRDNYCVSRDKNVSIGGDISVAPPGHYGANFNTIKTPTTIGEWNNGNKLKSITTFKEPLNNWENVYFRNPGENSVLNPSQYDRIGGIDLVRFKLGGAALSATIEPVLEKFSKSGYSAGNVKLTETMPVTERKKRTQVINFLSAEEASHIGLDTVIRNYDAYSLLDNNNNLQFQAIPRFDNVIRRKNHISEIDVTEASGQRYIYGIPVYNLVQKDFTFTVNNSTADTADRIGFSAPEATTIHTGEKDGYLQTTTTPAYAHSFLLSGLLSPDYVDVTGNGISEDDQGNAVKFNYTKIAGVSKWRTPLTSDAVANFNAGRRTEDKDDKGIVSYGERESWYVHSIESKTMIAVFTLENRNDMKGSATQLYGLNSNDTTSKRLREINLYNKADLKKNGLAHARPIKTVHFTYSYKLCKGTPDNINAGQGKLTLESLYFTFNGQKRANKNQYVFAYGDTIADNPSYAMGSTDRWGNYKPRTLNRSSSFYSGNLKNADYPYAAQSDYPGITSQPEKDKKAELDRNASAWMLKKILLPSGGQLEVKYESDDYAYVQNKRATVMMQVVGFGATSSGALSKQLYAVNGNSITDYNYVFIKVPEACNNSQAVFQKYLAGIEQLSFKMAVRMPKGVELMNAYATINSNNYGVYSGDVSNKTIWIKLNTVDNINPLSLTAIEFLREQLPGQAYRGYDISESTGLEQVGQMLAGLIDGLRSATKDPVRFLRQEGKAQLVDTANCFVRLNDPDGFKYGGGYRVKSVTLKDNWRRMNQDHLYTAEYGQEYTYTTTEVFNGVERTISSGVATYEPSLGGEENPFQTMFQVSNKVPLGPASYGAIEMPVLDAFFPAPSVGYSKVSVKSVKKGIVDTTRKSRSGIGRQVTEFYTAKDYPVYYSNTILDPSADKTSSSHSFGFFFYKYAFDARALSQGFLVETNDMHGKMKSQASYPENDDKTPISFTQNFYRNTGARGLNEKFDFIYAGQSGIIAEGNMGIDAELMVDTREFSVKTKSLEIQGQLDLFPVLFPFWLPFVWPVVGESDNVYRAVTTTKVVSYHSVLDSVVVIDKGSQVSTKNLVYDAETGDVIINRTNNEFNKSVFTTTYPAWWAYSGMGLAYKNINAVYKKRDFLDGALTGIVNMDFESGDEVYIIDPGTAPASGCGAQIVSSDSIRHLWVMNRNKSLVSLTDASPQYIFIDAAGKPYTRNNVSFKIIRSGHRNLLNAQVANVVSMSDPVTRYHLPVTYNILKFDSASKVINASAMEYREKWQIDNDLVKRYDTSYNPATCTVDIFEDCNGFLDKSINPYVKGLLGNFRPDQSKVFYEYRKEKDPAAATNLASNGFLDSFKLYWSFNGSNNLVPDVAGRKWVWNSRITKMNAKGLELETQDALGIYTAAQYGFNKTMPVAIASNSRYNEMFAEDFEDKDYSESLNGATANPCARKHIDLCTVANTAVENTDTLGFNAHSGKYVLRVNTNSTASRSETVADTIADGFNLSFGTKPVLGATGAYGTAVKTYSVPSSEPNSGIVTFNYGSTLSLDYKIETGSTPHTSPYVSYDSVTGLGNFQARYKTAQYMKVITSGTYTFSMSAQQVVDRDHLVGTPPPPDFSQTAFTLIIKTAAGDIVDNTTIYSDTDPSTPEWSASNSSSHAVYLNCGEYIVETLPGADITETFPLGTPPHANYHFKSAAGYSCSPALYSYVPDCLATTPVPATAAMLNSEFVMQPDKKMLFSAWIKEYCTTPCGKSNYDSSSIEIWSGGSAIDTIPFAGPVIEGWQKFEGTFKVPPGATDVQFRFINKSLHHPMYVDDIRVHPFNANMKSYVYDPVNLRLVAELDANNYGSFYEYDTEGTLVRTKVETREGIKTVTETRSAKQKNINTID